MNIDEKIDKWARIGLIEGMEKDKLPKLVELYEDAVEILTNEDDEETETLGVEELTFPITYRVVRDIDIDDEVTASEIIETIKESFPVIVEHLSNIPDIDVEAEAAARVCGIIIENVKNKRK